MVMSRADGEIGSRNDNMSPGHLEHELKSRLILSAVCSPATDSPVPTDEKGKESNFINDANDEDSWRYPDLSEVIADLNHPDDDMKLNAAAYLQHLSYQNDSVKTSARELNAFTPLIKMLLHTNQEVIKSALGALRNLSCGRTNDSNKVEIMKCCGIQVLVDLLRTSNNHHIIEMTSGILWNLSSSSLLKDEILEKSLDVMFNLIVMPLLCCISTNSCQPPHKLNFSNFRHATGIIRNVSSSGGESRMRLRQHCGLASSLMSFISWSLKHKDVDEKSVENCVCALRNLSYNMTRECQSDGPTRSRSVGRKTDVNRFLLGSPSSSCFRSKKMPKNKKQTLKFSSTEEYLSPENDPSIVHLLMGAEVVAMLIQLLQIHGNNVDICEAVLGTTQNLCISNWESPVDTREHVRMCQGLHVVVHNLTMFSDRVVVAAASLLKCLTTERINQDIIGQMIMDHLLNRLPPVHREDSYSDQVYNLIVTTVFECIGPNTVFARNVLVTGGVKQLTNIVQSPASFGIRASRLAAIMLRKIWSFDELHADIRIRGLKKSDFMIEPPKRTSVECLDVCASQIEGRSKKVRFSETARVPGGGCHNNEVLDIPHNISSTSRTSLHSFDNHFPFASQRNTHSTSAKSSQVITKQFQSPITSSLLFASNTLPRPCPSVSSSARHCFPLKHRPIFRQPRTAEATLCCATSSFVDSTTSSSQFVMKHNGPNLVLLSSCHSAKLPASSSSSSTPPPKVTSSIQSAGSCVVTQNPPVSTTNTSQSTLSSSSASPIVISSSSSASFPTTSVVRVTTQPIKTFIPTNSWV